MQIDISEVTERFPEFRVAVVIVDNLTLADTRPPELGQLIDAYEARCRMDWAATALSEIPGIAVWRDAYRAFGIKRTSYRSSVERLVKNALAGRPLPAINSFVDAYNAVSLAHVMPAGADDLDQIAGGLAFRYSRPGDSFLDMAGAGTGDAPAFDPPKNGEVVYADAEKVLCRRWNWRQDARSLVTTATRRAVVTLQFNGAGDLDAAVRDLSELIGRFAHGRASADIADRARPVVRLA